MQQTLLQPGLKGRKEVTVTDDMLACRLGSGLVTVYATAMMIAGMEATAVESVQPLLPEGMTTVGTHVDVSHVAATPSGMLVRFESELTGISENGRGLTFRVAAYDESGLIGEGRHERVVVHRQRFEERTRSKGRN